MKELSGFFTLYITVLGCTADLFHSMCDINLKYKPVNQNLLFSFRGWFWGYEETRGLNVSCLSVQGSASVVAPILLKNTSAQ